MQLTILKTGGASSTVQEVRVCCKQTRVTVAIGNKVLHISPSNISTAISAALEQP